MSNFTRWHAAWPRKFPALAETERRTVRDIEGHRFDVHHVRSGSLEKPVIEWTEEWWAIDEYRMSPDGDPQVREWTLHFETSEKAWEFILQ